MKKFIDGLLVGLAALGIVLIPLLCWAGGICLIIWIGAWALRACGVLH